MCMAEDKTNTGPEWREEGAIGTTMCRDNGHTLYMNV